MNNLVALSQYISTEENFTTNYTNDLTVETKRAYIHNIKEFFNVNDMGQINISVVRTITFEHINLFRRMLEQKGRANATVNRKISALSSFFDYVKALGYIKENPCKSKLVKRMKVNDKSSTNWMKMDSIKDILDNIENKRNYLICKIFASTGLRNNELRNIKLSDFKNIDSEWYLEVLGKGEKVRLVYIKDEIKEEIEEYIKTRNSNSIYLFVGESRNKLNKDRMDGKAIYNIIIKYFPKGISPHSLRHSCTTEMIDKLEGKNLNLVQEMLGHSSINTVMRYDHKKNYFKNNPGKLIKL